MPEVSVLMSVYNGERYLSAAIESILEQSFSDFEFIIVDDGSNDSTWAILKKYAAQDQRIVLLQNKKNIGLTKSLNEGLKLARGEFIARQDADDTSLTERLELQLNYLRNHDEIGVLGTWVLYVDEKGRKIGEWRTPCPPVLVQWLLLFGSSLAHPSVMLRRSLMKDNSGYDPTIEYAQDQELWVRLSSKTKLANLPIMLYQRRVHEDMIGRNYKKQQERTVKILTYELVFDLLGENVTESQVLNLLDAVNGKFLGTESDLEDVTFIIRRLFKQFIIREKLSHSDQRLVGMEAGCQLQKVGLKHMDQWPATAIKILYHASRIQKRIPNKPFVKGLINGIHRAILAKIC